MKFFRFLTINRGRGFSPAGPGRRGTGRAGRLPRWLALAILFCGLFPGWSSAAGSASENYSVPTSIFSGGGRLMSSAGLRTNGTVGQTSPAAAEPAVYSLSSLSSSSADFVVYSGFWFTLEAFVSCDDLEILAAGFGRLDAEPGYSYGCDLDGDGDIDGLDLAAFAGNY